MLKNIQLWQRALRQITAAYWFHWFFQGSTSPYSFGSFQKEYVWNIHPYNYGFFLADMRGFHYEVLCRDPKIQYGFLQERWTKLFLTYHTMHGQPLSCSACFLWLEWCHLLCSNSAYPSRTVCIPLSVILILCISWYLFSSLLKDRDLAFIVLFFSYMSSFSIIQRIWSRFKIGINNLTWTFLSWRVGQFCVGIIKYSIV